MDVLLKSLESTKQDAKREVEVPREVHGILAVQVKTIELFETEVDTSMAKLLQLKLTVCGSTKTFSFQQSPRNLTVVLCDSIKHFSIELPEDCDHHGNNVLVELILCSPLLPGAGSIIGKALLHIHDIIHQSPLSAKCELRKSDSGGVLGHLLADWAFTYGNFGYGESYQLIHSLHKPADYLHFSFFPRLTPPSNRADHNGLIQNPHPTRHPVFIPFSQTAVLSVQGSDEALGDTHTSIPQLLISHMDRLHKLHKELKRKADRRQRLQFLEDLVLSDGSVTVTHTGIGVTTRKTNQSSLL